MRAKTIMIQGTASNAGKSVLATALCRLFAAAGLRTAPFKAWNMALNSYVTKDGREISRAQGVQAEAAGIEATGDMNPFLVKPAAEERTQILVRGQLLDRAVHAEIEADGRSFAEFAGPIIAESLARLVSTFEVVVIEGAGSPVELNLKQNDVANMNVARLVEAPVILVADVDRGGALAGIVGTIDLLEPEERRLVIGSVLNRFRGDFNLLRPGLALVEARTGKPVLGVIPFLTGIGPPDEDSVALERAPAEPKTPPRRDWLAALAGVVGRELNLAYICRQMGFEQTPPSLGTMLGE